MLNMYFTMLTLCFVVAVGYAMERKGMFSQDFSQQFSRIIVDVTCPALILSSVMGEELPDSNLILPLLGVSFTSYIVISTIALLLPRVFTDDVSARQVMSFIIIFGNVGFIGYPVCQSLFGDSAVFYASILNFPNTLFVFTIGAILLSGKPLGNWRDVVSTLVRPGCIASYLSMIIVFLHIDYFPLWFSKSMQLIGNVTVPGSLFVIGAAMAQMPFRKMVGNRLAYISAFVRLTIVPLIVFGLFRLLPCDDFVCNINTIVFAMPVASFGTMFCLRYGRDTSLMTQTTFITTIASMLSIPLLAFLLTM